MFHTVLIHLRGFVRSEYWIYWIITEWLMLRIFYFRLNQGMWSFGANSHHSRVSNILIKKNIAFLFHKRIRENPNKAKNKNINSNKNSVWWQCKGITKIEKWFFDWEAENSENFYEFSWNSMDSINESMLLVLFYLVIRSESDSLCGVPAILRAFSFHSFTFLFNQIFGRHCIKRDAIFTINCIYLSI